jgi:transglutaminase-like putative cysteine protease
VAQRQTTIRRDHFTSMHIHCSYDIAYTLTAPTVLVLALRLRPELDYRLCSPERFTVTPNVFCENFLDAFGNRCVRLTSQAGLLELSGEVLVEDSGWPAPVIADAREHGAAELPADVLPYLLPSRYCEVDLMGPMAWNLFGGSVPGWSRVQAICDWVHAHLRFDYGFANATRTAAQACEQRVGVCRDFTHLAITLCRCLNIPARYVSGYLGDIGVSPDPEPMDFSACMEVYLGHAWHHFDVRHNARRIGYLPMAHGRDAADVAFTTSFGPHLLNRFIVRTYEVTAPAAVA